MIKMNPTHSSPRHYHRSFILSMVIPVVYTPIVFALMLLFSYGSAINSVTAIGELAAIALASLFGALVVALPFALLNHIQLRLLAKAGFPFDLKHSLLLLPALFASVFTLLFAVVILEPQTLRWSVNSALYSLGNNNLFGLIVFIFIPSTITGIAVAFVWGER